MPRLPKKLSKSDKFATEWNAMVDFLMSLRPAQGTGTRTTQTVHGVVREAGRDSGRGSGGDPVWLP